VREITVRDPTARAPVQPFQLFILALSLYALAALAAETLLPVSAGTHQLLEYADTGVCVLFFLDFLYQLFEAPSKWGYFTRWGWIDLLSSVPMVNALRVGRIARVARILRVLRGMRSTKLLASFILERRAHGAFLAATLVSLLLIVFASIAVLQFESGLEGANIKTAADALWWSAVTITTVGYGDRYPITPEGRAVAVLLMMAGVGLFGTISGFVTSWLLASPGEPRQSELELLRSDLAEIRRLLDPGARGAQ
jgi:voltage-gated potassium channel